jgi:hypothetical protein
MLERRPVEARAARRVAMLERRPAEALEVLVG